MDKPLTLGDLPVKTLLKFLKIEIETTSKIDKRAVSTVTLTCLLNALVDTYNSAIENVNTTK